MSYYAKTHFHPRFSSPTDNQPITEQPRVNDRNDRPNQAKNQDPEQHLEGEDSEKRDNNDESDESLHLEQMLNDTQDRPQADNQNSDQNHHDHDNNIGGGDNDDNDEDDEDEDEDVEDDYDYERHQIERNKYHAFLRYQAKFGNKRPQPRRFYNLSKLRRDNFNESSDDSSSVSSDTDDEDDEDYEDSDENYDLSVFSFDNHKDGNEGDDFNLDFDSDSLSSDIAQIETGSDGDQDHHQINDENVICIDNDGEGDQDPRYHDHDEDCSDDEADRVFNNRSHPGFDKNHHHNRQSDGRQDDDNADDNADDEDGFNSHGFFSQRPQGTFNQSDSDSNSDSDSHFTEHSDLFGRFLTLNDRDFAIIEDLDLDLTTDLDDSDDEGEKSNDGSHIVNDEHHDEDIDGHDEEYADGYVEEHADDYLDDHADDHVEDPDDDHSDDGTVRIDIRPDDPDDPHNDNDPDNFNLESEIETSDRRDSKKDDDFDDNNDHDVNNNDDDNDTGESRVRDNDNNHDDEETEEEYLRNLDIYGELCEIYAPSDDEDTLFPGEFMDRSQEVKEILQEDRPLSYSKRQDHLLRVLGRFANAFTLAQAGNFEALQDALAMEHLILVTGSPNTFFPSSQGRHIARDSTQTDKLTANTVSYRPLTLFNYNDGDGSFSLADTHGVTANLSYIITKRNETRPGQYNVSQEITVDPDELKAAEQEFLNNLTEEDRAKKLTPEDKVLRDAEIMNIALMRQQALVELYKQEMKQKGTPIYSNWGSVTKLEYAEGIRPRFTSGSRYKLAPRVAYTLGKSDDHRVYELPHVIPTILKGTTDLYDHVLQYIKPSSKIVSKSRELRDRAGICSIQFLSTVENGQAYPAELSTNEILSAFVKDPVDTSLLYKEDDDDHDDTVPESPGVHDDVISIHHAIPEHSEESDDDLSDEFEAFFRAKTASKSQSMPRKPHTTNNTHSTQNTGVHRQNQHQQQADQEMATHPEESSALESGDLADDDTLSELEEAEDRRWALACHLRARYSETFYNDSSLTANQIQSKAQRDYFKLLPTSLSGLINIDPHISPLRDFRALENQDDTSSPGVLPRPHPFTPGAGGDSTTTSQEEEVEYIYPIRPMMVSVFSSPAPALPSVTQQYHVQHISNNGRLLHPIVQWKRNSQEYRIHHEQHKAQQKHEFYRFQQYGNHFMGTTPKYRMPSINPPPVAPATLAQNDADLARQIRTHYGVNNGLSLLTSNTDTSEPIRVSSSKLPYVIGPGGVIRKPPKRTGSETKSDSTSDDQTISTSTSDGGDNSSGNSSGGVSVDTTKASTQNQSHIMYDDFTKATMIQQPYRHINPTFFAQRPHPTPQVPPHLPYIPMSFVPSAEELIPPREIEHYGTNLLHWSIDGGSQQLVEYLLSLNLFDIDQPNNSRTVPLMTASLMGNATLVHSLIRAKADIWQIHQGNGSLALHYAVTCGAPMIIHNLLSTADSGFSEFHYTDLLEREYRKHNIRHKVSSQVKNPQIFPLTDQEILQMEIAITAHKHFQQYCQIMYRLESSKPAVVLAKEEADKQPHTGQALAPAVAVPMTSTSHLFVLQPDTLDYTTYINTYYKHTTSTMMPRTEPPLPDTLTAISHMGEIAPDALYHYATTESAMYASIPLIPVCPLDIQEIMEIFVSPFPSSDSEKVKSNLHTDMNYNVMSKHTVARQHYEQLQDQIAASLGEEDDDEHGIRYRNVQKNQQYVHPHEIMEDKLKLRRYFLPLINNLQNVNPSKGDSPSQQQRLSAQDLQDPWRMLRPKKPKVDNHLQITFTWAQYLQALSIQTQRFLHRHGKYHSTHNILSNYARAVPFGQLLGNISFFIPEDPLKAPSYHGIYGRRYWYLQTLSHWLYFQNFIARPKITAPPPSMMPLPPAILHPTIRMMIKYYNNTPLLHERLKLYLAQFCPSPPGRNRPTKVHRGRYHRPIRSTSQYLCDTYTKLSRTVSKRIQQEADATAIQIATDVQRSTAVNSSHNEHSESEHAQNATNIDPHSSTNPASNQSSAPVKTDNIEADALIPLSSFNNPNDQFATQPRSKPGTLETSIRAYPYSHLSTIKTSVNVETLLHSIGIQPAHRALCAACCTENGVDCSALGLLHYHYWTDSIQIVPYNLNTTNDVMPPSLNNSNIDPSPPIHASDHQNRDTSSRSAGPVDPAILFHLAQLPRPILHQQLNESIHMILNKLPQNIKAKIRSSSSKFQHYISRDHHRLDYSSDSSLASFFSREHEITTMLRTSPLFTQVLQMIMVQISSRRRFKTSRFSSLSELHENILQHDIALTKSTASAFRSQCPPHRARHTQHDKTGWNPTTNTQSITSAIERLLRRSSLASNQVQHLALSQQQSPQPQPSISHTAGTRGTWSLPHFVHNVALNPSTTKNQQRKQQPTHQLWPLLGFASPTSTCLRCGVFIPPSPPQGPPSGFHSDPCKMRLDQFQTAMQKRCQEVYRAEKLKRDFIFMLESVVNLPCACAYIDLFYPTLRHDYMLQCMLQQQKRFEKEVQPVVDALTPFFEYIDARSIRRSPDPTPNVDQFLRKARAGYHFTMLVLARLFRYYKRTAWRTHLPCCQYHQAMKSQRQHRRRAQQQRRRQRRQQQMKRYLAMKQRHSSQTKLRMKRRGNLRMKRFKAPIRKLPPILYLRVYPPATLRQETPIQWVSRRRRVEKDSDHPASTSNPKTTTTTTHSKSAQTTSGTRRSLSPAASSTLSALLQKPSLVPYMNARNRPVHGVTITCACGYLTHHPINFPRGYSHLDTDAVTVFTQLYPKRRQFYTTQLQGLVDILHIVSVHQEKHIYEEHGMAFPDEIASSVDFFRALYPSDFSLDLGSVKHPQDHYVYALYTTILSVFAPTSLDYPNLPSLVSLLQPSNPYAYPTRYHRGNQKPDPSRVFNMEGDGKQLAGMHIADDFYSSDIFAAFLQQMGWDHLLQSQTLPPLLRSTAHAYDREYPLPYMMQHKAKTSSASLGHHHHHHSRQQRQLSQVMNVHDFEYEFCTTNVMKHLDQCKVTHIDGVPISRFPIFASLQRPSDDRTTQPSVKQPYGVGANRKSLETPEQQHSLSKHPSTASSSKLPPIYETKGKSMGISQRQAEAQYSARIYSHFVSTVFAKWFHPKSMHARKPSSGQQPSRKWNLSKSFPPLSRKTVVSTTRRIQKHRNTGNRNARNKKRLSVRFSHQPTTAKTASKRAKSNQRATHPSKSSILRSSTAPHPSKTAKKRQTAGNAPKPNKLLGAASIFSLSLGSDSKPMQHFYFQSPIPLAAYDYEAIQRVFNLYWSFYQVQRMRHYITDVWDHPTPSLEMAYRRNMHGMHSVQLSTMTTTLAYWAISEYLYKSALKAVYNEHSMIHVSVGAYNAGNQRTMLVYKYCCGCEVSISTAELFEENYEIASYEKTRASLLLGHEAATGKSDPSVVDGINVQLAMKQRMVHHTRRNKNDTKQQTSSNPPLRASTTNTWNRNGETANNRSKPTSQSTAGHGAHQTNRGSSGSTNSGNNHEKISQKNQNGSSKPGVLVHKGKAWPSNTIRVYSPEQAHANNEYVRSYLTARMEFFDFLHDFNTKHEHKDADRRSILRSMTALSPQPDSTSSLPVQGANNHTGSGDTNNPVDTGDTRSNSFIPKDPSTRHLGTNHSGITTTTATTSSSAIELTNLQSERDVPRGIEPAGRRPPPPLLNPPGKMQNRLHAAIRQHRIRHSDDDDDSFDDGGDHFYDLPVIPRTIGSNHPAPFQPQFLDPRGGISDNYHHHHRYDSSISTPQDDLLRAERSMDQFTCPCSTPCKNGHKLLGHACYPTTASVPVTHPDKTVTMLCDPDEIIDLIMKFLRP